MRSTDDLDAVELEIAVQIKGTMVDMPSARESAMLLGNRIDEVLAAEFPYLRATQCLVTYGDPLPDDA